MINQLCLINKSLVNLSQELSNKQASNQQIRECISNLESQVKYLDQKQKCHYYFLISEIYASRFQNIEDAQYQLSQFRKSLDQQISMNCSFRIAFYKYFQQNYKQAFKYLDDGFGFLDSSLKYTYNAKFFFNRAINREYLISEVKKQNNFEAGFILSFIYEQQKQQIQALKQMQMFLKQEDDSFKRFQICKRILQLYESMRKNQISTISISKKSLQTYKEELSLLQNKNSNFLENYKLKHQFVISIINFIKSDDSRNKQKLQRKMLDFKLLAYFKLKKCSKLAPNKQIQTTLQNTAKLIKSSKDTELLESTLNYDFVKEQYDRFKIFYKLAERNRFFMQRLMKWLKTCQPVKKLKTTYYQPSKSQIKKLKYQPNEVDFKPMSVLRNPSKSKIKKQYEQEKMHIREIQTQFQIQNFEGSKMRKFNATSEGSQQRYFYVKFDKIKQKPKIFYCNSKKQQNSNDNYYKLKGLTKILRGKQTPSLKRKDANKYEDSKCFSLIFDDGKERSFYVQNEDDYQKWIILLQTKVLYAQQTIGSKVGNQLGYSKSMKKTQSRQSPYISKSKVQLF